MADLDQQRRFTASRVSPINVRMKGNLVMKYIDTEGVVIMVDIVVTLEPLAVIKGQVSGSRRPSSNGDGLEVFAGSSRVANRSRKILSIGSPARLFSLPFSIPASGFQAGSKFRPRSFLLYLPPACADGPGKNRRGLTAE